MLQSGSGVESFLGGQQQHVFGDALNAAWDIRLASASRCIRRSGCVRDIESLEEPNRLGLCAVEEIHGIGREFAKKYNLHSIVLISTFKSC